MTTESHLNPTKIKSQQVAQSVIIDYMMSCKTGKSLDFNKALYTLVNSFNDLPQEVIEPICYLIQQVAKKEVKAMNLDNPFKVCSLFRAKKDVRYYLNHIYSNNEYLIASDGCSLVRVKHEVPAGYYSDTGIMQHDTDYAKFPNFEKAYNKISYDRVYNIDELKIGGILSDGTKYLTIESKSNLYAFDESLINRIKKLGITEFYLLDSLTGLHFKHNNIDGILMCIRVP